MKLIAAIFLAAMATTVQAARIPITVDFNGSTAPFQFRNECHDGPDQDQFWPDPAGDGTFWVSQFCPHDSFLEPQVIITRADGRHFTFLGFDSPSAPIRVRSSRGGELIAGLDNVQCGDFDPPDCQWDLTTDLPNTHEWRNVQWVSLCPDFGCDVIPDEHAIGLFDNVRFSIQVPEPAPLTLIGIALGGLAFIRRRAMQ